MGSIIAIDGGGSTIRAVLCNEKAVCLQSVELRIGCNPNDVGFSVMCDAILSVIRSVSASCDESIIGICAGISGISTQNYKERLFMFLAHYFPEANIKIVSDIDISYANGLFLKDGGLLLSGTGVVGFCRKNNIKKRFGGYGFYLDHGGSGYDFGRDVYYAALSDREGTGPHTQLTRRVEQKLGCSVEMGVDLIYEKGRAFLAQFAPIAFECAKKGDVVANEIIRINGCSLGRIVKGIIDFWDSNQTNEPCKIILSGSIFRDFDLLSRWIYGSQTQERVLFIRPQTPPIFGGVIISLTGLFPERSDIEEYKKNFTKSYNSVQLSL